MQMLSFSVQPDVIDKLSADEAWRLGSGWISKDTDLNGLRDWVLKGQAAFVCAHALGHQDLCGVQARRLHRG